IHAVAAQLVEKVRRNAASPSDVLAVGDDQIDLILPHDRGKFLVDDLPPRPSDDVAKRKNAKSHRRSITGNRASFVEIMRARSLPQPKMDKGIPKVPQTYISRALSDRFFGTNP